MPIRKTSSFPTQYRELVDAVSEGLCVRLPFESMLLAAGFRSSFYTYRSAVIRDIKAKTWPDEDGSFRTALDSITVLIGAKLDGKFEVIFVRRDDLPKSQSIAEAIEAARKMEAVGYPSDFSPLNEKKFRQELKQASNTKPLSTEDILDV